MSRRDSRAALDADAGRRLSQGEAPEGRRVIRCPCRAGIRFAPHVAEARRTSHPVAFDKPLVTLVDIGTGTGG